MPDVTHCSTLYHHLFGTGNILKYFLINHVPAIGFASRLCCLIPDSRHDSWHGRLEKPLSQFFISVNHPAARRTRRRRKRRWCQDLTQDTLPRLVRVTDKSETCWRSGQPLSDGEAGRETACTRADTRTDSRGCLRQIKSTLVYNAQCLSKWLCALLWLQETDRHTVHCLIILLVSCLARHISDKATNQMGGPPLPVSLNSLTLRVEGKYCLDINVGNTWAIRR